MTVLPLHSHRSRSELLMSFALATASRCSAVSFGLAMALSSSEKASTGLRGLDSQRLKSLERTTCDSWAGAGLQVDHVEVAVKVAQGRAGGVFLLRVGALLGQQLPGEQILRLGEEDGERDADDLLRP